MQLNGRRFKRRIFMRKGHPTESLRSGGGEGAAAARFVRSHAARVRAVFRLTSAPQMKVIFQTRFKAISTSLCGGLEME